MATSARTSTECLTAEELNQLLQGRLSTERSVVLTDHLGICSCCQERLEGVAAGDPHLTTTIRHCDRDRPPVASAMWPALSAVAAEISTTAVFPDDADADALLSSDVKLHFLSPAESPDHIGKLGSFEISRVLGRGGMGVVLHAYDPCLRRDVAIKVLDPLLAGNEVARQRFCREARAAAAVTHENLVAVHQVDVDEASGLPYMVMQLVAGESLDKRLKRVKKFSVADVVRLGMQAAAGLAAAHASGLIHRDIKPGNILLEGTGDRVKLTDFGLARATMDVKLTRTGFVAGTPLYMAPEQARGDEVDVRADLFSLGSVLYEAAAGVPPFDGKTPLVVLRRVADETQISLRSLDPSIPQWLSDVIDRLLAKDPNDRFQTSAEVAEIFSTELTRSQGLAGYEEPVGLCGAPRPSAYALRSARHKICWKAVAFRTIPWMGGAVLGGLVVGLWPGEPASPGHLSTETAANGRVVAPSEPTLPPLALFPAKSGPVWSLSFAPDGQTLVVGAEDGSVRLVDPKNGEVRRTIGRMGGNVWSVDVSPDAQHLVVACDDSEVKVYSLKTYAVEFAFPQPTSTKAAVFSPDGKYLATGDRNATIRVWDMDTQIPTELEKHHGTVHGLAFSPDGKRLASAGSDGAVKVWDLHDPKKNPVSLEEHSGSVYGLAFSPNQDKPRLASAGWDGTVRIWDASNGDLLHTLRGHVGDVWAVSFGKDGKILASGGSDGTVRIWDVETGKELHAYRGGNRGVHCVRFASDGITLAAAGRDGQVRVWEVQ